jgi:hypothetical protein
VLTLAGLGAAGREPTSRTRHRRHPQIAPAHAVRPAGRILVRLDRRVGRQLLARLVERFVPRLAAELAQPLLGGDLTSRRRQRLPDRRAPELLRQAFEDLLNGDPGRRDQSTGRRRRGAQRHRDRDGHADQLDHEDAELDPRLELRALDVAAGLLHHRTDLVADVEQRVERGVLVGRQPAPGVDEALRRDSLAAVPVDHLSGRVERVEARLGQRLDQAVPPVGDVPGGRLVTRRPLDTDDPLERFVGPAGQIPRAVVEWVRDRARQDGHGGSFRTEEIRSEAS